MGNVKQEWNYCVSSDIAGDVLFCVVGAHLFLVDVLLEDVPQDVWVDFVVLHVGSFVEMPLVVGEEIEYLLERLVRNLNIRVVTLNAVDVEYAAV